MFSGARARKCCGWGATCFRVVALLFGLTVASARAAPAPELEEARTAFTHGQYDSCIAMARDALKAKEDIEEWSCLLTRALLTRGQYPEALAIVTNAISSESRSIRLRWWAREAFRFNGQPAAAAETSAEIQRLFTSRYWLYRNARDLVVFGRVAYEAGMEPKVLLDKVYEAAKKADPKLPDPYLASGELALDKHDFALAARFFQEGLKQAPDDPELHLGLARAYAPSEQKLMLESLTAALERNSNHLASLLLLADHNIDAEEYATAEKLLSRVEAVNPSHPEAWAYRAIIAHLRSQPAAETAARTAALKFWPSNPRVDYLIGQKLSQKYRFAEGARHQRRALAMDSNYLPSKGQLAQDLLRLGEEDEGWRLADEVQKQDNYDVAANNLVTLHGVLSKYQAVTNDHFVLRMQPREAAVYGGRALGLLERARAQLCRKYGLELTGPVLVELFGEEKDFAVRTFGMPDNEGFLGVCFGNVITANSPAARPASHFNWESTLWHEFCHVVTLQLTRNKMPRWLSEGISVYEERQAEPSWGERLNPRYRDMLLGDDFTPLSKLSGAFLAPKSGLHLQFAYYESSLAVQFVVEHFGAEKLLEVLRELGRGVEVNEALAKQLVPMPQLEKAFAEFARKAANELAPGVDFERPTPENLADVSVSRSRGKSPVPESRISSSAWELWGALRPTNYWVQLRNAERLVEEKKWKEAEPVLENLIRLYPGATGAESPYRQLALAERELGRTNTEAAVLTRFAALDDQAPDAYIRLMQLAANTGDWATVLTNAERYLAVDPLVPPPYRFLARASEALDEIQPAIQAYRALLQLDPPNPAEVHYQLGRLLFRQHEPEARRHVLEALEEAPRYRDALRLLRKMREPLTNTVSLNAPGMEVLR